MLQWPLDSVKCTARITISKHRIIELFWFENVDEETVIVKKERYIDMLNKFWRAPTTRCVANRDVQCFQQEGITPYTANITMKKLDHRFLNRLISIHPDLNPQIFFFFFYLWGFLKNSEYGNNPPSIAEPQSGHKSDSCQTEKKRASG